MAGLGLKPPGPEAVHRPACELNELPPHQSHHHSPEPYLEVVQSHDVFMLQFLGQKPKFPVSRRAQTPASPLLPPRQLTLRILISFPSSVWDLARFFLLMHLTATSRSCF